MTRLRSLLVLLFALACAGCEKKADPTAVTQHFFELVGSGRAQEAYKETAFGFQAQRSATVFETAAKEMGLTDYASAKWQTPEIDGRNAKVSVVVNTRGGQEIPLIVSLTKESSNWRIHSLRSPPNEATGISENRFTLVGKAPTFNSAATQPVPPEAELRQLARETLLRFNEAIASKSFDAFYDSVSYAWQNGTFTQGQNQLTKGQLQRAFQPFIDKEVSLAGVEKVEPIWDAPIAVGTDGLLVLSGYFPTEPYRTHFSMKFVYELPSWKLFGLDINLRN